MFLQVGWSDSTKTRNSFLSPTLRGPSAASLSVETGDVDITAFSHWSCLTRGERIRTCFPYYICVCVSQNIHRSLCTPWWMSGCLSYMSYHFAGNLLTMMDVRWLWIPDEEGVKCSRCTVRRSCIRFLELVLVKRCRYAWFQATAAM